MSLHQGFNGSQFDLKTPVKSKEADFKQQKSRYSRAGKPWKQEEYVALKTAQELGFFIQFSI